MQMRLTFGLQELQLGDLALGGTSASINEFQLTVQCQRTAMQSTNTEGNKNLYRFTNWWWCKFIER